MAVRTLEQENEPTTGCGLTMALPTGCAVVVVFKLS